MAKCNGIVYMLGGYGGDEAFPSDVWTLSLDVFAASAAKQQAALPEPADAAVQEPPSRCEASCWKTAKRSRAEGHEQPGQGHKRQRALAPAGPAPPAHLPDSHLYQPLQQAGGQAAAGLPPLQPDSHALQPQAHPAVDRNRASGCAMLPAATPALYGGCAFSDAAAMSATVTRLEAELAHAKASLSDRMASEEGLARQRRALEADVARLHAEVLSAQQQCGTTTQQCAHFQRLSEDRLQQMQAAEKACADAISRAAAAVATAGELQSQLSIKSRQRDEYAKLDNEREEAAKACEADALKARAALRQERLDWEKADAESRNALHSLREEWRMLQDTNAQLHANVTRLTKALEVAEGKVGEGVNKLAEVRRQAGEEREEGSKALHAQQAAKHAAQQQLQAARVQIHTAEEGQKKLEVQLSELQPHAASLEESFKDSQSKLKAAETALASVRADLAQTKEAHADSTKSLEKEGQQLADTANELLKLIARQRTHSPGPS